MYWKYLMDKTLWKIMLTFVVVWDAAETNSEKDRVPYNGDRHLNLRNMYNLPIHIYKSIPSNL